MGWTWSGGPAETLSLDSVFVQGGQYAGRLDRDRESELEFSSFGMTLPVTFSGETLELRGWLRTDRVTGFAGLWLRQDGRSGSVQFDNMQSRNLRGSTEWTEYRISLPLDGRARTVVLGAILVGEGTAWVDNLELLVDGIPASDAPPFLAVLSAVDLDDEFDDGSRVELRDLTPTQVENLTLLGRIWGFVKYHHPRITGGTVNWDYELFRILPSLLDARDRMSARVILEEWLDDLGDPDSCGPCAVLPADSYLSPDIDWIRDRGLLGDEVSGRLELIYNRRPANLEHYYVSHEPGVGNPLFLNEATYQDQPLPDAGFRLLALYRYWNIIEYWFPYRDVIGENWIDVLFEFVPQIMATRTVDEYRLTLTELIARINDTHANLRADSNPQPPRGSAELPIVLRFVEDEAVVTGFSHPVRGPATGLRIGEALGLQWTDLDLTHGVLSVTRSLQNVPKLGFIFNEPKTEASKADVPMSPSVVSALKTHQARQAAQRLALGSNWKDQGLVFPNAWGSPMWNSTVSRALHRSVKKIGLEEHINIHDLRRTTGSLMAEKGVPIKQIQGILRHARYSTTMDLYVKNSPESLRDAANMLEDAITGRG